MADNKDDKIMWLIIGIVIGIIIETSIILVLSNIKRHEHVLFERDQEGRITSIHYVGSSLI